MVKTIKDSKLTMTELVLPHHTNQLGNLLGGQLMHWIDICAALSASKHSQRVCVTKSVDFIDFKEPHKLGDIVVLDAKVNRVFNTSMEVMVCVYKQSFRQGTKSLSNTAYLTFVSVDDDGKPVKSFEIVPETEEEIKHYEEALQRREERLDKNKNQ
jgi:acyl-CoA hydrolase